MLLCKNPSGTHFAKTKWARIELVSQDEEDQRVVCEFVFDRPQEIFAKVDTVSFEGRAEDGFARHTNTFQ